MGKIWDFEQFHNANALIDDKGVCITYDDLCSLMEKVEHCMGDRALVMMLTRNTIGGIAGYASFLNSGFPLLLVSAQTPQDMRERLMKIYRPAIMLIPSDIATEYPFMKAELDIYDFTVLRTNYTDLYPVNDKLGLLLTTSGSTGSAKFVRQSFENILFNTKAFAEVLGATSADRQITSLPMHYSYGITVINSALMQGSTIIVTEKSFMEEDFWDLFEEQKVTAFHGVPETYEMLEHIGIFEEDFPSLKLIAVGGGKISSYLHDYYARLARDREKAFMVFYGQCETTGLISYLSPEFSYAKTGSVGVPEKGGRITIIDQNGNIIDKADAQGELCFESPSVALGYAQCGEDIIKGDEWNGRIRTGDIGRRDDEGFYFITGRLKRYIKVYGHRISLDEIDEMIMEALHIRSISSGTDDHPVIFVNGEPEREAVTDFIRKSIPNIRTSFKVAVIESFPVNESGKVRYSELLDIAKELIK